MSKNSNVTVQSWKKSSADDTACFIYKKKQQ